MNKSLKHIADLQFGLHSQSSQKGEVAYLQARHFNELGRQKCDVDTFLTLSSKEEGHLLKEGDILFTGKGFRNFAWCYHSSFGPAVASSMFFVIRPDADKIFPDYLTAILNLPKNQIYFQQLGSGSKIPSIRKSELAEFPVNVLPLEKQKKVVALQELHLQEMELMDALLKNKKDLYTDIVSKLIYT